MGETYAVRLMMMGFGRTIRAVLQNSVLNEIKAYILWTIAEWCLRLMLIMPKNVMCCWSEKVMLHMMLHWPREKLENEWRFWKLWSAVTHWMSLDGSVSFRCSKDYSFWLKTSRSDVLKISEAWDWEDYISCQLDEGWLTVASEKVLR